MKEIEQDLGVKLIITCFIDDLDRCLDGANVKVSGSGMS